MSQKIKFYVASPKAGVRSTRKNPAINDIPCVGYLWEVNGYQFAIHRPLTWGQPPSQNLHSDYWALTELQTGRSMGRMADTIAQLGQEFQARMTEKMWAQMPTLIAKQVASHAMPAWEVIGIGGPKLPALFV
jgi:hypothetical protein